MTNVILEYLTTGVEVFPDSIYGDGYRCSVYLKDGTYLPCVMLRKSGPITALALRRFEEERNGKGVFRKSNGYEKIVKNFVASGNSVNHYDIEKVEASRYAIPLAILNEVKGETSMGSTRFVLEMRDGRLLAFSTALVVEFFSIPEAYTYEDVVAVHNHSYVSSKGELRTLVQGMSPQLSDYDVSSVNRERPYFVCYYDA